MTLRIIAVGMSIYDCYKQKNPKLVVESDGVMIGFYVSHNDGIANKSKSNIIENMKHFYRVTKKPRIL